MICPHCSAQEYVDTKLRVVDVAHNNIDGVTYRRLKRENCGRKFYSAGRLVSGSEKMEAKLCFTDKRAKSKLENESQRQNQEVKP